MIYPNEIFVHNFLLVFLWNQYPPSGMMMIMVVIILLYHYTMDVLSKYYDLLKYIILLPRVRVKLFYKTSPLDFNFQLSSDTQQFNITPNWFETFIAHIIYIYKYIGLYKKVKWEKNMIYFYYVCSPCNIWANIFLNIIQFCSIIKI